MTNSLMRTYAPLPIHFSHGEGAYLWDAQGNRYLDALSGIAVCGLGHAHPAVAEAIADQAKKLVHVSNLYHIGEQEKLADRLTAIAGMERVFFCNSGAEANEASLKLARLHGHARGLETPKILVCEGSFHGRTLATLSATGNQAIQQGFEPLVEGFIRIPYGDVDAIEAAAQAHDDIAAILVEPVQGEGGVNLPADDYLPAVRALCDRHDWLMMLDEVQTGMGRTGHWFAFQHHDFVPDVMNLAKGLGNGFPIGACLANGKAASLFGPGKHGSTFGGNPLGCRTAATVIDVIESERLMDQAAARGQRLLEGFRQSLAGIDGVTDIRGTGLMIGIELNRPCAALVQQALEQERLLINVTAGQVVRLLPPLIISDEQATAIIASVSRLVREFLQDNEGDQNP